MVRNGSIRIVAGGSASVNGRLSAGSRGKRQNDITVTAGKDVALGGRARLAVDGKSRDAGNISVKAAGDITIRKGATLSASSAAGKGGNIVVFADGNLTAASGTRIDVSSQRSDAGFAELSAKKAATVGTLDLNFAAPNGKAGTLLLDPYDLVIGGVSTIRRLQRLHHIGEHHQQRRECHSAGRQQHHDRVGRRDRHAPVQPWRQWRHARSGQSLDRNSGTVSLNAPNITINGSDSHQRGQHGGSRGTTWSAET